MLKCQFHIHTAEDPRDSIPYTAKNLINFAKNLNYDVLAISCHNRVVFDKNLKRYAEQKGILLISGIELTINKKHVLIINVKKNIYEVNSFKKLREYKISHPECLIIAPHPFFPGDYSLKKDLIENIDIFDAIEYPFCYTKTKNYNKEAVALAKRWKKPIISTSDCHIIKYLDLGYALVNASKNTQSIIKAIKENKFQNITRPISYFLIGKIILRLTFGKLIRKLFN